MPLGQGWHSRDTMHVLSVIDHPNPQSFTHALVAAFHEGAEAAGHSTETMDLHAAGFNPVWSMEDIDQGATPPKDVAEIQQRIEASDAICLAFPLFWYGMPAMMKGWVDRVWTYGWAYDQTADPHLSLLRSRIGVLLVPAGGNPAHWEPHGFEPAMQTIWRDGMMGYFGLNDQRVHILAGATGSDQRRAGLLERARSAGETL